jgi:putative PIN family toxin of toxin-antitoxin system
VTPRILCDTNVLISAFISGGPPSRVIEAAIDGRVELVLADPVLVELDRVLRVKLGFEPERIREIVTLLDGLASARVKPPTTTPEAVSGDSDDDLILACATAAGAQIIAAGAQIIVSGDRKHMLPIGEHNGMRIITSQTLLAELANA